MKQFCALMLIAAILLCGLSALAVTDTGLPEGVDWQSDEQSIRAALGEPDQVTTMSDGNPTLYYYMDYAGHPTYAGIALSATGVEMMILSPVPEEESDVTFADDLEQTLNEAYTRIESEQTARLVSISLSFIVDSTIDNLRLWQTPDGNYATLFQIDSSGTPLDMVIVLNLSRLLGE